MTLFDSIIAVMSETVLPPEHPQLVVHLLWSQCPAKQVQSLVHALWSENPMEYRKMSGVLMSITINDNHKVHTTDGVAMVFTCWHVAFISEDRSKSKVAVTFLRALCEIASKD